MSKKKSKIRIWVEGKIAGKLSDSEWNMLRGKFSNKDMKVLSRDRIMEVIGNAHGHKMRVVIRHRVGYYT